MPLNPNFDLTYVTVDAISEGVGSSQILPVLLKLSNAGLSINLMSFEKDAPSRQIEMKLAESNIVWNRCAFKKHGYLGGFSRFLEIISKMPETDIIHARSDIPAVAAILSRKAPVLWDIRSLWADQRAFMEANPIKKKILSSFRVLEDVASFGSSAISTLTSSVVPILEERHKNLPELRIVVPTAVDLQRFKFVSRFPAILKGLYSGTYNNYYDLALSKGFIQQISKIVPLQVDWARPKESRRALLDAGESSSFFATQIEMATIIPNYSFGISICKLDAGPSLKAAMPTKAAEFLSCGRPIVVNAGLGDLGAFVQEFNAGVVLDGSQSNLLEKVHELLEILDDPETPYRCRALAEKYFDLDKGVEKYLSLYSRM